MRIISVTISGFRSYLEPITISFEKATTTIVGKNDAGKSTILEGLDVFFGAKVELTDFSVGTDEPIEITCCFADLPDVLVLDVDKETSLEDEYLLDENGFLTIKKSWSRSKLTTPTICASANHPTFETQTDLLSTKITALKKMAQDLGVPDQSVSDRRTSSGYRKAIWDHAIANGIASLEKTLVPLAVEDGKSIALALGKYLPIFHLFRADRMGGESDKLAQDPAMAAVKAVLEQHQAQLDTLATVVQAQITSVLEDVVTRLGEVAPELAASLRPTDTTPSWAKAFSSLQFIDENGVALSKRGSGTRRLVLLSFFRATAESNLDEELTEGEYRRGVITAVEEPETALHANLQNDILSALLDVGELDRRQMLLTTHSANLIKNVPVDSIRYISTRNKKRSCVVATGDGAGDLLKELNASLGIFTDHNVRCFVLVEGRNDVTGLKNLTALLAAEGMEGVESFARLEEDGLICFLPIGGGGNASLWETTLSPFRRHEVHIMDSDRTAPSSPLKDEMTALKARADDMRSVYILDRREMENYLSPESVVSAYADINGFASAFTDQAPIGDDWNYADIPDLCASIAHSLASKTVWGDVAPDVRKSKQGRAKRRIAESFLHESVHKSFSAETNDLLDAIRLVVKSAHAAR